MKQIITAIFVYIAFMMNGCSSVANLTQITTLYHYASGSTLVSKENRLYLMGDDMNYILLLNSDLTLADSILLGDKAQYNISKDKKEDLEASTFLPGTNEILLIGSGSLSPYRNTAWIVDVVNREKHQVRLEEFYKRLTRAGINEVNIEGITATKSHLILANRGNKSNPQNHLIVTSIDFYKNQALAPIKILKVNNTANTFNGISGLEYSFAEDKLLMSVSTEDTHSAFSDGAIGKSYLWIINDLSAKTHNTELNIDVAFDLEKVNRKFRKQKIESVTILQVNSIETSLVFVADNDNGTSTLFKVSVPAK